MSACVRSTMSASAPRSPRWAANARRVTDEAAPCSIPPSWNQRRPFCDCHGVNCAEAQVATSALLDGELPPLERRALEQHLVGCDVCRAYCDQADALQRRIRVRPADRVPDLTDEILARAPPPRPGRAEWVRYALAIVALTELVMSLPALLLAEETGATAH